MSQFYCRTSPLYPLDGMLIEPQSCFGSSGGRENSLHVPKICHGISLLEYKT